MRKSFLFILFSIFSISIHADSVEPLLDGWVRHQSEPFSNYCPKWTEKGTTSENHCLVGCVATALETIVSYYQREIVLQDTLHGWKTTNYTVADVLPGTRVDTRLILKDYGDGTAESVGMDEESYANSVDAVARLSMMCGVAAKMNYGLGESGADSQNLIEPLKNAFGWKTAEFVDSYKYTPEKWKELLKNELRNGRPIFYTGYTMNISGHAFVIDGFNEEGKFHVNWGYGGSYDGNYYDITELAFFAHPDDVTPLDKMQGFFCNQQALFISPEEVDLPLIADSLNRTGYEIEVKSIKMDSTCPTGKFVPVTITLHNSADVPLCSPFEIFTNLTSDTKPFEQGDYGALFGVNMEPDETLTLTIYCKFNQKGYRTVHVSPDDVAILGNTKVTFVSGSTDQIVFDTPTVSFPDETTAVFTMPVRNEGYETSGSLATYCMNQGSVIADGDFRHFEYIVIPAGESTTKTVTFKHLEPKSTHNFVIRCPWKIQQEYIFTMGQIVDGLEPVFAEGDNNYYDLSGRHMTQPKHGILIHNGKKVIR